MLNGYVIFSFNILLLKMTVVLVEKLENLKWLKLNFYYVELFLFYNLNNDVNFRLLITFHLFFMPFSIKKLNSKRFLN